MSKNWLKRPGPVLKKRLNCMPKQMLMATASCPSRNLSPLQRLKRRLYCPNPSLPFVARSAVSNSLLRSKHRPNNGLNRFPNNGLSRCLNNRLNKIGSNSPRNRVGLVSKPPSCNQRFDRVFTAVDAVLDWIPTGASVRCAASKTSAIEGSVGDEFPFFKEQCFVHPNTWMFKHA